MFNAHNKIQFCFVLICEVTTFKENEMVYRTITVPKRAQKSIICFNIFTGWKFIAKPKYSWLRRGREVFVSHSQPNWMELYILSMQMYLCTDNARQTLKKAWVG